VSVDKSTGELFVNEFRARESLVAKEV